MSKQNFLQVGDVFNLTYPMNVYLHLDDNSQQDVSIFPEWNQIEQEKLNKEKSIIDSLFKAFPFMDPKSFYDQVKEGYYKAQQNAGVHAKFLGGEYVVVSTAMTGGGTGHGAHDVYPDGHLVTATKLNKDGKFDPDGKKISFYQSGSFTAKNEDVPVTRKMKMQFV